LIIWFDEFDNLSLDDRESTIAEPNTGRIDWPGSVDLLELQAWVRTVGSGLTI